MNRTFGAAMGYSSGRNSSRSNFPPSYGDWKTTTVKEFCIKKLAKSLLITSNPNKRKFCSVEIQKEQATYLARSFNFNLKVSRIFVAWWSAYSRHRLCKQSLCFLKSKDKLPWLYNSNVTRRWNLQKIRTKTRPISSRFLHVRARSMLNEPTLVILRGKPADISI